MRSTQLRGSQSGFTLIELVVVIVILGILAATALPKFIDLSGDAKKASVAGVYGGFNSAVAMVRAKWMVDGASPGTCSGTPPTGCTAGTVITIDGSAVGFNYRGNPVDNAQPTSLSDGVVAMTNAKCVNVWKAILGGQGPAIAATDESTVSIKNAAQYLATGSTTTCTYTYASNGAAASPGRSFTYDIVTGAMALTNP